MRKITGYLFFLFVIAPEVFSQSFVITPPRLEFTGKTLNISFDILSVNNSGLFKIWVEMYDQSGKPLIAETLKGDTGDNIVAGTNKNISWTPADDGIYIDEDISVEIKGMRYGKEIRRSSLIIKTSLVPGLGMSKLKNGKPWWLMSIPAYGALAGGVIAQTKFNQVYGKYKSEKDAVIRSGLLKDAQNLNNMSGALYITSATIWAGNLIWILTAPEKSKKLNTKDLTISSRSYGNELFTVISFRSTF